MSRERGTLQYKLHCLLLQLRQSPNSTGTSSYHLMFGREVRKNLSLFRPETEGTTNSNEVVGIRRQLKPEDRQSASKKLRQQEDQMEPWAYRRKRGKCTVQGQNGQRTVM